LKSQFATSSWGGKRTNPYAFTEQCFAMSSRALKSETAILVSSDWKMLTGKPFEYRFFGGLLKPKNTKIHGCDIAGKVEAIGKNVKHF
jgi:hypothetical protein